MKSKKKKITVSDTGVELEIGHRITIIREHGRSIRIPTKDLETFIERAGQVRPYIEKTAKRWNDAIKFLSETVEYD